MKLYCVYIIIQFSILGQTGVAQWISALDFGSRGCEFESHRLYIFAHIACFMDVVALFDSIEPTFNFALIYYLCN